MTSALHFCGAAGAVPGNRVRDSKGGREEGERNCEGVRGVGLGVLAGYGDSGVDSEANSPSTCHPSSC